MKKLIWAASGLLLGLICAGIIAEVQASRNSAGTYSIPSTFVAGTTISSSAVNGNFSDIGSELTNSLDRNGKGGMLAALRGVDGTLAAPALSFTSETGSGLFRNGAGDVRMAVAGTAAEQWTASAVLPILPLRAAAGLVSAPSLSFAAETSIGWYRNGAGDIRFAVSGADKHFLSATGFGIGGAAAFPLDVSQISGADHARFGDKLMMMGGAPQIGFNIHNDGSNKYMTSNSGFLWSYDTGQNAMIGYTAPVGVAAAVATVTERIRIASGGVTIGASGTATSQVNFGTCTLNGGTPAQCTATVVAGAKCFANVVTTTAANTRALGVGVAATTLTVTSSTNGDVLLVNYVCF